MNQTRKIAIALGANLGEKTLQLRSALARLEEDVLSLAVTSHIYETPPWGIVDQPHFYNAVVIGLTDWKPPALLNYMKRLEVELGRTSSIRNGPRKMDLDLIAFAEEVWEQEGLSVPHPRLAERDFVLVPLVEVWADWNHPVLKVTARELLARFQQTSPVQATKISPLRPDTASR